MNLVFRPSNLDRTTVCLASAREEAQVQEPEQQSLFAEEGTVAHSLGERVLKNPESNCVDWLGQEIDGWPVDQEMVDAVQRYVDAIRERASDPEAILLVEQTLPMGHLIPGGKGTGDAIILFPKQRRVENHDLKYGKGVKVFLAGKRQLPAYASGARLEYAMFGDFDTFGMWIHQPRLDHVDTLEMSGEELDEYEETIREAIAKACGPAPEYTPTEDACRWCRVKATCKARADYMLSIVADEWPDLDQFRLKDSGQISPEGLAELYPRLDSVTSWVNELKERVKQDLEAGVEVPGLKLVNGTSRREWDDEKAVEQMLTQQFRLGTAAFTRKMLSPAQATKLTKGKNPKIGKIRWKQLQDHIATKQYTAVAPMTDPRPAVTPEGFDDLEQET